MKIRATIEIQYDNSNRSSFQSTESMLRQDLKHLLETSLDERDVYNIKTENADDSIYLKWTVNDVIDASQELDVDFELSKKEARKILKEIKSKYDASQGVDWDVIKAEIREYLLDNPRN